MIIIELQLTTGKHGGHLRTVSSGRIDDTSSMLMMTRICSNNKIIYY